MTNLNNNEITQLFHVLTNNESVQPTTIHLAYKQGFNFSCLFSNKLNQYIHTKISLINGLTLERSIKQTPKNKMNYVARVNTDQILINGPIGYESFELLKQTYLPIKLNQTELINYNPILV